MLRRTPEPDQSSAISGRARSRIKRSSTPPARNVRCHRSTPPPLDRRERELKSLLSRPTSRRPTRASATVSRSSATQTTSGPVASASLQRETQPRAVQREEVSAYGVFPIDPPFVSRPLRRERCRQPQFDRVFVARREPFRAELRQGRSPSAVNFGLRGSCASACPSAIRRSRHRCGFAPSRQQARSLPAHLRARAIEAGPSSPAVARRDSTQSATWSTRSWCG